MKIKSSHFTYSPIARQIVFSGLSYGSGDNINNMKNLISNCRKIKLKSNHITHSPIARQVVFSGLSYGSGDNVNDMKNLISKLTNKANE